LQPRRGFGFQRQWGFVHPWRAGAEADLQGPDVRTRGGMKVSPTIEAEIAAFCRRHHVRKLAFFGSVLHDDFAPESDVDVLVEFEPGARVGFITLAGMEIELGQILGRKVEMHTVKGLNPLFRDSVLNQAQVQYECA
jgi:predicted nucleotidyltransferase